ncbi:MAG: nucleotide sugar dehydrogenase [Planctomycetota bacterium]
MPLTVSHAEQLTDRIRTKEARVGIIGLGYVGLPLINAYVEAGYSALGYDVDPTKVEMLNRGETYIAHIKPSVIQGWIDKQRFEATADMSRLGEADVLLICVPTPLSESRDPDLRYVESTARAIAESLRPGQLVILESTTYPGTTRDVIVPILARSGLAVGEDFFVAYSPEREDPGNKSFSTSTIPKVVGGLDPTSLSLADLFYQQAMSQTVPVSSCEIAEACKILENTYRSVNIAMVNELKMIYDRLGIDVWEVIDAAKTKPFGFQAFYPGPGLGGHCIPIDPFYLSWVARKHELPAKFIELSGEINSGMPLYVVNRVAEALNSVGKPIRGSKIGVLGVAYKKDIDDPRESPAYKVMELLNERGADLSYSDPQIPTLPEARRYRVLPLESESFSPEYLGSLDCAVVVTDHSAFDPQVLVDSCPLVIDTRNLTAGVDAPTGRVWKA